MNDSPVPIRVMARHARGCDGAMFWPSYDRTAVVTCDRTGRIGNGCWNYLELRCNRNWASCPALIRVSVTQLLHHSLALAGLYK